MLLISLVVMIQLKDIDTATKNAPRILIETLISQIVTLEKAVSDSGGNIGNSANYGSFEGNFSNLDGAILLNNDEFHTPWTHFVGLGYDENNPFSVPPTVPSSLSTNQHHTQLSFPSTGATLTLHSPNPSVAASVGNRIMSDGPPTSTVHASAYEGILHNDGIPKYLWLIGNVKKK
jgi:hypothetical protein